MIREEQGGLGLAQGLSSSSRAYTALETRVAQPGPGLEIGLYISLTMSRMAEIKTFIQTIQ